MTLEAVKVYSESVSGDVIIDYTCSNTTGIEKGTLLSLKDPRTVAKSDTESEVCAGILAREKIASDGRTRVAVYKKGYFDVYASGAITVGAPCMSAGTENNVKSASAGGAVGSFSGAQVIGYAEETAADKETFVMRLDL